MPPRPILQSCGICNAAYTGRPNRKFCSKTCAGVSRGNHNRSRDRKPKPPKPKTPKKRKGPKPRPRVTKTCVRCGNRFRVILGSAKGFRKRLCSKQCQVNGMKLSNPMKRPEVAAKVSKFARNRSPALRNRIGLGVSRAWKDGKFDGVKVGRCEWYSFIRKNGRTVKLQGTWELAFADWLDSNGIDFVAHRGWVKYSDGGKERTWYPDFYVSAWGEWVDVKCRHFYRPEKFDAIRRSNPDKKVKVLFREDLEGMGVMIYVRGGRYTERLTDLVRRGRL